MSTVVVLGGCGGIGRVAARALAVGGWFDELVVADLDGGAAAAVAASLDHPRARGVAVDATDPATVVDALDGARVAVGCIGPFYRFGAPLLRAAIDAGVDYVDVCDDLDATERQLELGPAAEAAGITALVGMGNSPGLANVMARFAADELLDEVHAVDIMHIHGGEPEEGPAVIKHRIHAMTDDVPIFLDGAMRTVRLLEESGREVVEQIDFRGVGTYPAYPYPHPETITLPQHLPGLRRATNRGSIYPLSYFELTMDTVRAGLAEAGPEGPTEADIDRWVAEIHGQRARLLAEAGITGPGGTLRVDVAGVQGGEAHTYVFSFTSSGAGAGEGTGIPVALGAALLAQGRIDRPGVHPPEAIVPPLELMALAEKVLPAFDLDGEGGEGALQVEHHGPGGQVELIDLGF